MVTPPHRLTHARRAWARLSTAVFLAGLLVSVLVLRELPPAPVFSPRLGRATYWQSYESAYFASLHAYEEPIRQILADGNIPIVVFGDSTIRATGAAGDDMWTRHLETRLRVVNSRVRVLNYAQNAGDLMGPFLYHYLQRRFPEARYIVQWHFSSEVGIRHPFHYWLTSEIALRDGHDNPAVRHSYKVVPVTQLEERMAFALAGLNILTNYLEVGNWVRYRWLGRPFFDADRMVKIQPLREVAESDLSITHFIPPVQAQTVEQMRGYFLSHVAKRDRYVHSPLEERRAYFEEMYPSRLRNHLLLLTLEFSPYYAPRDNESQMNTWRSMWTRLRADMARIPDLRWVSLTGSAGEFQTDDYIDLGHLTVPGQQKLADAVADNLLAPGGWFDPATLGAEQPPPRLAGKWYETKQLKPYQLESFQFMNPRPSRFFSTFGVGLNGAFCAAHPLSRFRFTVPAGTRHLHTEVRFDPGAYENLPADQATDGIELEIAILTPDGKRTIVATRTVDPRHAAADRGVVPIDVSLIVPAHAEIELQIGPGEGGHDTRDWVYVGPLTIQ